MRVWLAIAIGGAVGALARYGVSGWLQRTTQSPLPWGTLAVNLIGSFLIGCAWNWLAAHDASSFLRALVVVGGLGAFTTFSTYSLEVLTLVRANDLKLALLYVLFSNLLCIGAVFLGFAATRSLVPA